MPRVLKTVNAAVISFKKTDDGVLFLQSSMFVKSNGFLRVHVGLSGCLYWFLVASIGF